MPIFFPSLQSWFISLIHPDFEIKYSSVLIFLAHYKFPQNMWNCLHIFNLNITYLKHLCKLAFLSQSHLWNIHVNQCHVVYFLQLYCTPPYNHTIYFSSFLLKNIYVASNYFAVMNNSIIKNLYILSMCGSASLGRVCISLSVSLSLPLCTYLPIIYLSRNCMVRS